MKFVVDIAKKNNIQITSNQLNKVFMLFDEIKEIRAPLKTPAWEASIGFNWYNKYARRISEKSLEQKSVTKSRPKFSCEIVLEFQK